MTINSTVNIRYSHTVGFLANTGRGFNNPVDVALDSQGVLYVLNRAGPEVPIRLPYKRVSICTRSYLACRRFSDSEKSILSWRR